jgi:hypothetical protein
MFPVLVFPASVPHRRVFPYDSTPAHVAKCLKFMEGALPVSGLVQLGFVKAKTVSGKTRIGALAKRARNREKGHHSIFGLIVD